MANPETTAFVNENREQLKLLAKHGDPALRPLAAAYLAAVPEATSKVTPEKSIFRRKRDEKEK